MHMDIAQYIITGIVIIIALTFHEFAHGLASYSLGDSTAKSNGRLTLNPFAHVDFFGLIMLFIVNFGWAKPVPINPYFYKNQRKGIIITSFAGPLANLILAFLSYLTFAFMIKNGYEMSNGLRAFFTTMVLLNVNLFIFNLLPIPPLDGSKIFAEIFRGKVADFIYKIDNMGMLFLLIILMLPPTRSVLSFLSSKVILVMESLISNILW